jgi:hypothetical protein
VDIRVKCCMKTANGCVSLCADVICKDDTGMNQILCIVGAKKKHFNFQDFFCQNCSFTQLCGTLLALHSS